jgi:ABC-type protease/lipase transport system fused ATPase/permease subunit
MEILQIQSQAILPILISHQMVSIEFLMLELLLKTMKMEQFGVLKEILAQIKRVANVMVDRYQRNFVHLRKINRGK